MSKISGTPAIVLNITGFFSGQRPDESHCNCISEQLAANHIVDVGCLAARTCAVPGGMPTHLRERPQCTCEGNHACPTSMAPLNASKA